MNEDYVDYHETRFQYDKKRSVLWETLTKYYFQKFVKPTDSVLELGAGYCEFINNIKAGKKTALDLWDGFSEYANKDVECIVGDIENIDKVEDNSVDFAFASNVFEHIHKEKLVRTLEILSKKLKANGMLCLLQPNYRYAYREYFDDYTHVTVWSDSSLPDFLEANGFKVDFVKPGFLPLSIKGKLPVSSLLIRLYLMMPFKPMAKQMLVIAKR